MGVCSEIQTFLSKSKTITKASIKLSKQCKAVIANYIGKENDGRKNGEHWFLDSYLSHGREVVVDVGANKGDWSKAALDAGPEGPEDMRLYSYEPDPRIVDVLKDQFQSSENVCVRSVAVGESVGKMTLFLNQESTELTSATPMSEEECVRHETRVTTLDEEVKENGLDHIDLLKIDVEGYERSVLEGASSLLESESVSCIQFEYGRNWIRAGATLYSVVEKLRGYGFSVYLLRPECLRKIRFDEVGEYFSYSNYVAVHDSAEDQLKPLIHPKPLL